MLWFLNQNKDIYSPLGGLQYEKDRIARDTF